MMSQESELYSLRLDGYWMNVKKPRDFLAGQAPSSLLRRVTSPHDPSPRDPSTT